MQASDNLLSSPAVEFALVRERRYILPIQIEESVICFFIKKLNIDVFIILA